MLSWHGFARKPFWRTVSFQQRIGHFTFAETRFIIDFGLRFASFSLDLGLPAHAAVTVMGISRFSRPCGSGGSRIDLACLLH